MVLSAQQGSIDAGVLIICWTLARAERLSRERRHGLECAHGPRAVARLLPGLMEPHESRRLSVYAAPPLKGGVALAFNILGVHVRVGR